MQPNDETKKLLGAIGLTYVETIADRRDTLALRVERDGKRMILKLHSEGESEESKKKAMLLIHEADILSLIPQLTNHLYVDHGSSGGRHWLLLREIDGQEVYLVTKKARESMAQSRERSTFLVELLLKVSGFYDTLFAGGYLHGDVQPAHTFLEGEKITVIDWGQARKIKEPNPLYRGGFIYYVAPEVAQSMRANDSDISYTSCAEVYALGSALFMFYTGTLALDFGIPKASLKETSMELKLQRVVENRIFSFQEVGADPHPALEVLLRKSLSTNPHDRFENPSQLHQQLLKLKDW